MRSQSKDLHSDIWAPGSLLKPLPQWPSGELYRDQGKKDLEKLSPSVSDPIWSFKSQKDL